ncbi:MAG: S-layer homology domain-containing protein [Thermoleophilia bacterium]
MFENARFSSSTTCDRRLPPASRARSLGLTFVAAALLALLLSAAAAGMVFVPAARAADGDFTFKGTGYGHGVGMSQWGAWAAARDGKDFRWIVGFYYPGATLEQIDDPNMELKVKLSSEPWKSVDTITQNFKQVDVHPVGAAITLVTTGGAGDTTEELAPGSFANLLVGSGGVDIVTAAGGRRGPYARVEVRPGDAGRIRVQFRTSSDPKVDPLYSREYWGRMQVEPSSTAGNLVVYNIVPIERYLRSIGEVMYDWAQPTAAAYAPEAVKAQAVAARTYAIANKDPYLNDNQWDQVYLGYTGRSTGSQKPFELLYPGIPKAAEETAGLILRYNGKVITSFFSSSSGGYTTAWYPADTYAYLPAKADPYSLKAPTSNPGWKWTFSVSPAVLSDEVDGMSDVDGKAVHLGAISRVEIVSRDTSDPTSHAARIRLTGADGSAEVSASSFRRLFGYSQMRSTLILEVVNPDGFVSTGPDGGTGGGGDGDATPLPPGEFTDVPPGHMYAAEIKRIALEGLVGGYANGEFRPDAPVSRWQFAKIAIGLHNALLPDDQIEVVDVSERPFSDVPPRPGTLGDESDWVAAAKAAGLVNGVNDTDFKPYDPVQRDQVATMLVRAMGWEAAAAALPSDTPGFVDVDRAGKHAASTTYLKSLDILRGYEEPAGSGTFVLRYAEPTKRMHVAVILCRVLDLQGG